MALPVCVCIRSVVIQLSLFIIVCYNIIRFKDVDTKCYICLFCPDIYLHACSDILRMDSTNADALYVRGLCLYYEDCIDKAVQFFVQALRMAPDHEKARLACRVSRNPLSIAKIKYQRYII